MSTATMTRGTRLLTESPERWNDPRIRPHKLPVTAAGKGLDFFVEWQLVPGPDGPSEDGAFPQRSVKTVVLGAEPDGRDR